MVLSRTYQSRVKSMTPSSKITSSILGTPTELSFCSFFTSTRLFLRFCFNLSSSACTSVKSKNQSEWSVILIGTNTNLQISYFLVFWVILIRLNPPFLFLGLWYPFRCRRRLWCMQLSYWLGETPGFEEGCVYHTSFGVTSSAFINKNRTSRSVFEANRYSRPGIALVKPF